jgi:hypothetical protein
LIDNGCQIPRVVADLSAFPALSSNVDAAIAKLRAGAMDSGGAILDIGVPSSIVQAPLIGLGVQKSGRTTGRTTGVISSINATVSVQYQPRCGMGKKFLVIFRNQVMVSASGFSAGGDSGALILTNDVYNQPVALLYAGNSTTTIGNPVGEVLSRVGQKLGRPISFVGEPKAPSVPRTAANPVAGQSAASAQQARDRWSDEFMKRPGVIGVGVGRSEQDDEAAVIVYVDSQGPRPNLPGRADGVRVRVVATEPFIAR